MSDGVETLGQRLQTARGRKGLSVQKAADGLRLDAWVIEALESGNYERIGPQVYAKGHLKHYAESLGLPVAEVLAAFDGAQPAPLPPQPAGMRMRTDSSTGGELPWSVILGCAAVAVALAGLMWWRPWLARTTAVADGKPPGAARPVPLAEPATVAPATAPSGVAPEVTGALAATGALAVTGAPVVPLAEAQDAGLVATAIPPEGGAGRARLRLSFLGDSWVDVHDASGQRLFAGTGHVNNVRSMSGEAPFRIYLKSASSIRLEINNHLVAIGPQHLAGDVAHFEAGADGILRRDLRVAPTTGLATPGVAPSTAAPAVTPGTRPHG
jgi:cytoskeleton protein RodZ